MRLFHFACILIYLMNIKQIFPQTNDSNTSKTTTISTSFAEACCSTSTTSQNISINTSVQIPKIEINPFRFLFSSENILAVNHYLLILLPLCVILNYS